jgi:acetate kinase
MSILVINAGSSSVKFARFDQGGARLTALIDWTADPGHAVLVIRAANSAEQRSEANVANHRAAVRHALDVLGQSVHAEPVTAVGHRVVHGGAVFHAATLIDAGVKQQLAQLAELAPLHNPPALEALAAAEEALPAVPHVAVFDTAFFTDLTPASFVYPLPYEWHTEWGIRRFGFHGISHAYCAGRATELLGRGADVRLVICHLGNGCSASAVRNVKPLATTMGFTPLEGLMMGTRAGSVDPGILLHVQRKHGLDADQLDDVLNHRCGLLGVSGVSSDFRRVEEAAKQGNERAQLALAIYAGRIREAIGSLAVTLGGVDALVFTAGVGEHAAPLRQSVCIGLECLGLHLDRASNEACQPDTDIAAADSPGRILVVHTDEELMIAREVRRVTGKA